MRCGRHDQDRVLILILRQSSSSRNGKVERRIEDETPHFLSCASYSTRDKAYPSVVYRTADNYCSQRSLTMFDGSD